MVSVHCAEKLADSRLNIASLK